MFFAVLLILQFSWKRCKFIFYPMYFCLKLQTDEWLPAFAFSCMLHSPFTRDRLAMKMEFKFFFNMTFKIMTILKKKYYCADHILRQSNRVLEANPKYYNDDFLYKACSYIGGALYTMCPLQVRTLASCDRDEDDALLNACIA